VKEQYSENRSVPLLTSRTLSCKCPIHSVRAKNILEVQRTTVIDDTLLYPISPSVLWIDVKYENWQIDVFQRSLSDSFDHFSSIFILKIALKYISSRKLTFNVKRYSLLFFHFKENKLQTHLFGFERKILSVTDRLSGGPNKQIFKENIIIKF
jgi:hypothetical protein